MPAEMVDVNVHPPSWKFAFKTAAAFIVSVIGFLRKKFLSTDLTAVRGESPAPEEETAAFDPAQMQQHRDELIRWATGQSRSTTAFIAAAATRI